jgi:Arc/MetJ-type ribon-helix-helix transcriptional regulator
MYIKVYTATMKNVQISIDEETLRHVDRAAEPLGLTRSEIVRQALRQWLQRRAVQRFEEKWIDAARERPDDLTETELWLPAQSWGRK